MSVRVFIIIGIWACGHGLSCGPWHSGGPPSITQTACAVFPPPAGLLDPIPAGPVEVVGFGPKDEARAGRAITLTLDRPLNPKPGERSWPQLVMEPEVPGALRMLGGRSMSFLPDTALPAATPFTVLVPAGSGGGRVGPREDFFWTFTTPRPEVLTVSPAIGAKGVALDSPISMTFNQAVDLDALRERLSVTARRKPVSFAVRRGGGVRAVEIVPRGPLPLGARVEVTIQSGLRGGEGLLPSRSTWRGFFVTHGPLRALSSSCRGGRHCDVDAEIIFNFSNPLPESVEPPVLVEPEVDGLEVDVWRGQVALRGRLAPGQPYKVRVSGTLEDVYGQPLGRDLIKVIRAADLAPSFALAGRDLAVTDHRSLSAQFLNVPSARWATVGVPRQLLPEVWSYVHGESERLPDELEPGQWRPISSASDRRNLPSNLSLPLPSAAGVWLARLEASVRRPQWAPYPLSTSSLVQRAELGLQLWYGYDEMLVWVTHMVTAAPLEAQRVSLVSTGGETLWEGLTDADGLAAMPGANKLDVPPPYFVLAGDESSYVYGRVDGRSSLLWDRLRGYEQTRFVKTTRRLVGHLYTDRQTYEAGQTIEVVATLRSRGRGGLSMLSGVREVRLLGVDANGDVFESRRSELSSQGVLRASLRAPDVPGALRVVIEVDGVQVRPKKVEASVRVLDAGHREALVSARLWGEELHPGQEVEAHLSALYRSGTPIEAAVLNWRLLARPATRAPAGEVFEVLKGQGAVSKEGRLQIAAKAPAVDRPHVLWLEAEMRDRPGTIAAVSEEVRLVPPGARFSLNVPEVIALVGERFEASVRALSWRSEPLAGIKGRLALERWQAGQGGAEGRWEHVDGCSFTTRSSPRECSFAALRPGKHRVVAAGHGPGPTHIAAAAELVEALEAPGAAGPAPRASIRSTSGGSIPAGAAARLVLRSPFERARALLTVSSMGLVESRPLGEIGPLGVVELPLDDRHGAGVHVGVSMIAVGGPRNGKVAWASARLEIAAPSSQVAVSVLTEVNHEEKSLKVRLETSSMGAPVEAEVTLLISDARAELPDPRGVFWGLPAPDVAAVDLRTSLVDGRVAAPVSSVRLRGERPRGERRRAQKRRRGQALQEGRAPTVVRPALLEARLSRGLRTDAQGRAELELPMPPSAAGLRVVAMAAAGDRFGVGWAPLIGESPLVLRSFVPARARVGDRFEARLEVENRSSDGVEVKVGAQLPDFLSGDRAQRRVTVPGRSALVLSFDLRAEAAGKGVIAFSAGQAAAPAALTESLLEVPDPQGLERVVARGRLDGALSQPLASLDEVSEPAGALLVSLGAPGLLSLMSAAGNLHGERGAGAVGAAARLVGALSVRGLVPRGLVPGVDGEGWRSFERAQLDALLKSRAAQGGFAMWPEGKVEAMSTFWALLGLQMASAAGLPVDESLLTSCLDAAEALLHEAASPRAERPLPVAVRAMGAALLARVEPGRVRLDIDLEPLLDEVEAGSVVARSFLALAFEARLRRVGDRRVAQQLLDGVLEQAVRSKRGLVWMDDAGRPDLMATAVALWALRQLRGSDPMVEQVSGALLDGLSDKSLYTAADALALLVVTPVVEAALMAPAAADRVGLWHREALVFTAPVDPGSEVVHGQISAQSLRAGGAELVMASEGAGPIDYRLELLAEARSGIDHGFDVDRVIVGLDGRPTRGLSSGEVFGIVVALSTREARRGAIVEIPLPGSMGLVDVEVAPTLSSARVEHVEQRPGCVVLFVGPMEEGLYEVSVALRAGAPGEYRVPGARVEDVEVPGAYGRSPSARVVVGP